MLLDEIVARRMLAAAFEAEVDTYLSALADEVDDRGHRLVVRNLYAVPRPIDPPAVKLNAGRSCSYAAIHSTLARAARTVNGQNTSATTPDPP